MKPSYMALALAAASVAAPAVPAHASAQYCAASRSGAGVVVCEYLAAVPVGTLRTSGAVQVNVTCTAGGTSSPGVYPQAGVCRVVAMFAGAGSFTAGGLPV